MICATGPSIWPLLPSLTSSLPYFPYHSVSWSHFKFLDQSSIFFFLRFSTSWSSTWNSDVCHTASLPTLFSSLFQVFPDFQWIFFCHFFFSIFSLSIFQGNFSDCDSIIMFTPTWPLLSSHDYQWVLILLLNFEPWNPKVCTACCPLFCALFPINLYLDLLWFSVFLPTFIPASEYRPCFSSFAIFLIYISSFHWVSHPHLIFTPQP